MKLYSLFATAIAAASIKLNTFSGSNLANVIEVAKSTGSYDLEKLKAQNLKDIGQVSWSQCPDKLNLFHIGGGYHTPNPFDKGETVTFGVKGNLDQPIYIAWYTIQIKLNGNIINS